MRASKREIRKLAEMIRLRKFDALPEGSTTVAAQFAKYKAAEVIADFIELNLSPRMDRNGNSRFDRREFYRECGL